MTTKKQYNSDFYNKSDEKEQWIRLTDGCFRGCWNCYAPKEIKVYDLPEIIRNKVRFLDMNFIYAHPDPIKLIKSIGKIKVNNKVVRYTFLCGLDFTLFTQELLNEMKKSRVGRFNNEGNYRNGLSIAWDRDYSEKLKINKSVYMMIEAGYNRRKIQVRMLCNGKVSFNMCVKKLKYLKILRVQVDDCWYNNQKRGSVKPIYWTDEECKRFGIICRAHNVAIMQRQYDGLDILYSD